MTESISENPPYEVSRALIVGATSAIGSAIAARFAGYGADLVVVARNKDKLGALAGELRRSSVEVEEITADLASDAGIRRLCESLTRRDDDLDCMVYAAGRLVLESVVDTQESTFDELMRVNFKAPFFLVRAMQPLLVRNKGQIVFLNSSLTLSGVRANLALYGAGKAGMRALADAVRGELNPQGVRVLSVFPGRTASDMQAKLFSHEKRAYSPEKLLQPQDIADTILAALLLPPSAEVTDISIRPFRSG